MSAPDPVHPEGAMRLALAQARRVQGRTFPNPGVGAVVFRGRRVLGRGATHPPGGAHAEIVALESARKRFGDRTLRGASMAVTLEPCCHRGRTGPCTSALISAGLERVAIGCPDPHPRVAGRGVRLLRAAGLQVELGVLEAECREQHRGFVSVWERGRPYVTLKLASSLDGRIATAGGESRWITSAESRDLVHRLRARVDAIMVGSGTALADDPELTARRGTRVVHRPVRVLVDSKLRVPASARLYRRSQGDRDRPAWVLCRAGARGRRARLDGGASVIEVPPSGDHLDLVAAMKSLAQEGLTTVLVEGGGELAAALLRADLVDEIHWFLATRLIGGDGRSALASLEVQRLAQAVALQRVRVRRSGADLHLHALVGEQGEEA